MYYSHSLFLTLLPALAAAGPGINPNPNPNFNPATSKGTFGPFIVPQAPAKSATGGPSLGSVDPRTIQAMQLAISNWQTDTGIVSLFLNNGGNTANQQQFTGIANGAFNAEVNELAQKGVLDQVIGNDPRVSLANLTLTNGVFQSVVDNLQIMSIQGRNRVNLIDTINQVRCTQILPSIDTYMLVAAEYIGDNAQQRRAVRPNACAGILAAAQSSAIPALPGTPGGVPSGMGNGLISGVPNACQQGSGISVLGFGNTTSSNGNTKSKAPSSAPTLSIGSNTTPQLGLQSGSSAVASAVAATGTAKPGSSGGSGASNFNPGSNGGSSSGSSGSSSSSGSSGSSGGSTSSGSSGSSGGSSSSGSSGSSGGSSSSGSSGSSGSSTSNGSSGSSGGSSSGSSSGSTGGSSSSGSSSGSYGGSTSGSGSGSTGSLTGGLSSGASNMTNCRNSTGTPATYRMKRSPNNWRGTPLN